MKKIQITLLGIIICLSANARVYPPEGVTMGPNPYPQPSFNPGECKVILSEIPDQDMDVIKYVWLEDFNKGLQPTVEKLKTLPCIVFDGVSEEDAKRIRENLIYLKCKATYEKKTVFNQELLPTVKTPVESGNEQGTAAEI